MILILCSYLCICQGALLPRVSCFRMDLPRYSLSHPEGGKYQRMIVKPEVRAGWYAHLCILQLGCGVRATEVLFCETWSGPAPAVVCSLCPSAGFSLDSF